MVFCDYKANTTDSATYAFGGTPEDISGEIVFHFRDRTFEIVKAPEKTKVWLKYIRSLYHKEMENFNKGVFREKISYESW